MGHFPQVFTDGSTATYTPSGALSVSYPSYPFVSHIADPLPLIDTDKEYFATIVVNGVTYYFGAFDNGNGTDEQKVGDIGRLIYSDGAGGWITDKQWHWSGALTLDMDDPTIVLTATSTPTLTNIIEYETGQDRSIGGITYTFPTDGRQYGYSGTYRPGLTALVTDLHNPLPVSSQAIDELFLGVDMGTFNNGYEGGLVYETEAENDVNNAMCKWTLSFNQTKALLNFNEIGAGEPLLLS